MAIILFYYFKDMFKAASDGRVEFESYHDNLTDMYKKMPVDEQGKYHHLVSEFMKGV